MHSVSFRLYKERKQFIGTSQFKSGLEFLLGNIVIKIGRAIHYLLSVGATVEVVSSIRFPPVSLKLKTLHNSAKGNTTSKLGEHGNGCLSSSSPGDDYTFSQVKAAIEIPLLQLQLRKSMNVASCMTKV